MDAYSKIPGFMAPTVRERLADNASIASVAMLPALFLAFLQRWHRMNFHTSITIRRWIPAQHTRSARRSIR